MRTQSPIVYVVILIVLWGVNADWNFQSQRGVPELKEWHFLGPFTVGKTEVDGDPLEAFGGIQSLSPTRNASAKFISELVEGGLNLYSSLNSIAVLEFQGWAVSSFSVPTTQSYLLTCSGIHNIEIDEREIFYHGDIYSRKVPVSVSLSAGNHVMRLRVRARAQAKFRCEFKPITSPFSLLPPSFAPDVHHGGFWGDTAWFSVGVQNHQSEKWMNNIVLSIAPSPDVELVESNAGDHSIAPGHLLLINFKVKLLKEQNKQEQDECVKFTVNVREGEVGENVEGQEYEVTLRCRRKDQSFMFTFVDHDDTVSHAAAIRPWSPCKVACPVILTLSGVGVPPQNQADSYKYMKKSKSKKEEWLFGMKDMWVLAPERDGAHNWEGTGHQTAIAALHALEAITRGSQYHSDTHRLIYAGHSRGGHGSWMLATLFSASGWTNREYYGDANILFEHDMNNLHMDGFVRHLLLATLAENDVALSAENLKNVAVMARVGGADQSVPAWHMRRYARLLKEIGANISWTEYAGKDHWWWDTESTNDGGVVFDAEVRNFFNAFHSPHITSLRPSFLDPGEVEVVSLNPATFKGKGGFRILQFKTPYQKSKLVVNLIDEKLIIKTLNVRRFQLYEIAGVRNASSLPSKGMIVDNTPFSHESTLSLYLPGIHFCSSEDSKIWRICDDGDTFQKRERGPSNYGPARKVFARPFAVVIPSSSEEKDHFDFTLRIALYIAYSHYFSFGTRVPIVTDAEMLKDPEKSKKYNFIFLGGVNSNRLQAKMQSESEVKSQIVVGDNGTLRVGSQCEFTKDIKGIGYVYTMPTWDDASSQPRLHLVVHGTSKEGVTDVVKFSFASNQALTRAAFTNMMPDYYVTGTNLRWKGYGGVQAIGFWGNQWEIRSDIGYFGCT